MGLSDLSLHCVIKIHTSFCYELLKLNLLGPVKGLAWGCGLRRTS